MKILKSAIIILLASYIIITLYYYFVQKSFIFYPSDIYTSPPEQLKIEEVFIKTSDGEKLHAWWMPIRQSTGQADPAHETVLFFHGNAGNLTDRTFRLDIFNKLGLNTLIIDYRGYGKSSGQIKKEQDLYTDGLAAWDYLIEEKKIKSENIIIWGRSLGGAIAVDLAQEKNVNAVILEATFASIYGVVPKAFRFLPIKLILKYKFASGEKIKNIQAPVLIIHSQDDEIIPFEQGQKLYDTANQPKQFLKLKGGHNSDVAESYEIYLLGVKDFLKVDDDQAS